MVNLVTSYNRSKFRTPLEAMHRDRKKVFVDALKWDIPVVDGQYEIDQFDTDAAIYLVALDQLTNDISGRCGCCRPQGRIS